MKTLIVYYSLSGNTELIATEIAPILHATVLRLKPVKDHQAGKFMTFFWGGMEAKMAKTPALEPYEIKLADYDLIVLGSPVWAWTIAPPLRSFVEREKHHLLGKKIALFMSAGGDGIKAMQRYQNYLKEFNVISHIIFQEPKSVQTEEQKQKMKEWAASLLS
jgi:flavodoxin